MAIISQTTWDKFTQEEKEKILKKYQEVRIDKEIKTDFNKWMAGRADEFEELFGKENLQPQPLTYEDVARELFMNKEVYWIDTYGRIVSHELGYLNGVINPNNCTSEKQAEKLLAINRLLNVAKFLNGKDWKPDWNKDYKFYLFYQYPNECVQIEPTIINNFALVYFKSFELAEQAVQILGENTMRLALSSDY